MITITLNEDEFFEKLLECRSSRKTFHVKSGPADLTRRFVIHRLRKDLGEDNIQKIPTDHNKIMKLKNGSTIHFTHESAQVRGCTFDHVFIVNSILTREDLGRSEDVTVLII